MSFVPSLFLAFARLLILFNPSENEEKAVFATAELTFFHFQMEVDEAKVASAISKPTTSTLGRSRKKKAAPQPPTKQPASAVQPTPTERKQSLESSGKSASSGGKRLKQKSKTTAAAEEDFLAFKVRVSGPF